MKRIFCLLLAVLCLQISAAGTERQMHPAVSRLPRQMVWAWERAEDLRWLPAEVGVAYVALVIELDGRRIHLRPRSRPLLLRSETPLVPVIHVDALWHPSPSLSGKQRDAIVGQVLRLAGAGNQKVVQLDFEVRRSQRAFLEELVKRIRAGLPRDYALSVTALASWCAGDYWLDQLQADEIVPMAFRMGNDDKEIRALLAGQPHFTRERCTTAVGLATDEPPIRVNSLRRYLFSPVPWSEEIWQKNHNLTLF
ncbi:hypothetical protein [Uliginosibacterium gangwonense]|uniref:hypothetical protein n=1 Tax=Uliginosibacterium gangwonense TaxID=392736 RepID=UPI0012FAE12B|nr:hypothetical protein [Uliginosibacterium gangwonense]